MPPLGTWRSGPRRTPVDRLEDQRTLFQRDKKSENEQMICTIFKKTTDVGGSIKLANLPSEVFTYDDLGEASEATQRPADGFKPPCHR